MPRRLAIVLAMVALLIVSGPAAGLVQAASPLPADACANRNNNTSKKLVECIQTDDLWRHMQAFQAIADANPGADGHPSRNSGEPGYKASADYVAERHAQGRIQRHDPDVHVPVLARSSGRRPGARSRRPPRSFTLVTDWNPGNSNGDATGAQVKPAGGIVVPPTPTPSSASGCDASRLQQRLSQARSP